MTVPARSESIRLSDPDPTIHADKLAQNKLNERDIKESLKEKRDKDKEIKHEVIDRLPIPISTSETEICLVNTVLCGRP